MRVCGCCGWRALCRQLCAVLCFFARSCGRFPNGREILRQLRANLIRPDNLACHHEVLNQPFLREPSPSPKQSTWPRLQPAGASFCAVRVGNDPGCMREGVAVAAYRIQKSELEMVTADEITDPDDWR